MQFVQKGSGQQVARRCLQVEISGKWHLSDIWYEVPWGSRNAARASGHSDTTAMVYPLPSNIRFPNLIPEVKYVV